MPQKASTIDFGSKAEDYASSWLKGKGYRILEMNFRTKFGEIDIIALDGDTLVFVEVKARKSRKRGLPEEAVTPKKLAKIKRVGQFYARSKSDLPKKQRIDVVAMELSGRKVISLKLINVIQHVH